MTAQPFKSDPGFGFGDQEKLHLYKGFTLRLLLYVGCLLTITACASSQLSPAQRHVVEQELVVLTSEIQLDPTNANLYVNRGNRYALFEQFDRSLQDYDKAIQIDPDNKWAYHNRGNAYFGLDQPRRAIEEFSKAIQLDPSFAAPYKRRSDTYGGKLDNRELACQDAKQACELKKEFCPNYQRNC